MYCGHCGAPIPDGSNVCPTCGTKLGQLKSNIGQQAVLGQTAYQPASNVTSAHQQLNAPTSDDEMTELLEHDSEPYSQTNMINEPLYPDESATIEPDGLNAPYDSYQTNDAFIETYNNQPGIPPSYNDAPRAEFIPDNYFENAANETMMLPSPEVPSAGYIPSSASSKRSNMYKKNDHDVIAIVAGIVLIASIAIIFVLVNPFGLGTSDDDSLSATTTIKSTDKSATLDEDSLITDDTSPDEVSTEEDTTSADESEKLDDDDTTSADTTTTDSSSTDSSSTDSSSTDSSSTDLSSTDSSSTDSSSTDSSSTDSSSKGSTSSTTTTSGDDYVLSDSAIHEYTRAELETMSNYDLYLARNEIYARHGRRFKKDELQEYFNSKSWYTPLYDPDEFSDTMLNDVEKANAYLMLDIEKSRDSPYVQP